MNRFALIFPIFVISVLFLSAQAAKAQPTHFTYQGSFIENGEPANGTYNFEFQLYDSFENGNPVGPLISALGVVVTNGNFTTVLDFGDVFPGDDRFLEIRIEATGAPAAEGASQLAYTVLIPRQLIRSAPYSIKSKSSTTSDQLGGVNASQYVVTSDARLSDARPPTPGSADYIQNSTGQQASSNFRISGIGRADVLSANTEFRIGSSAVLRTPGVANTFVGRSAGVAVTSGGGGNSFFGSESGKNITFGSSNSFFGLRSGQLNTEGERNSFFGADAGNQTTTGSYNSFFGANTGFLNDTGENNAFFGASSGNLNSTGNNNSFFGRSSGGMNTTADDNSFFGANAGNRNSTGTKNSFFGRNAGEMNTTGDDNSFFGALAGRWNTASTNSFFGRSAGEMNTTGNDNSFFGFMAGAANVTAIRNSYFGWSAGVNATASDNSLFGSSSGLALTTGFGNAFFGVNSGNATTSGQRNTFVGAGAGITNISGNLNAALGRAADVGASNLSNATAIGAGAIVTANNRIQLGRNGTDTVSIGALASASAVHICINGTVLSSCTSSLRYKESIFPYSPNTEKLLRLTPVMFRWKATKALDFGLIAEEVEKIEPMLVSYNTNGQVEGVHYERIGVLLVNVVKEQQDRIGKLEVENRAVKEELAALKQAVCSLAPESEGCN